MSRHHYTATDRQAAVDRFRSLRDEGASTKAAVQATGIPRATLLRWVAEAGGEAGADDDTPKAPKARPGRPPAHRLTDTESTVLRALRLRRGSLPLAVDAFLSHESCRPETARWLSEILDRAAAAGRAPSWPPSLRRAAHVSEEEEAAFRGPKALSRYLPTVTRGAFWIDAHGNEIELLAHDIWESDDMSVNEPFRHIDPATGEQRIGRQMLVTTDRLSAAILGLTLIGRDRDAYRADDILDHALDLIDVFGMPRLWRIERGVWESNAIQGVRLDDARARSLQFEGERWKGRRIGGIGELFRVEHMYSSNGKGGVESAFNHLQAHTAHDSLSIGRNRGEFELSAKELRRAQDGIAEAIEQFWDQSDCAAGNLRGADAFNSQPKKRALFGDAYHVPNDLLRSHATAKRPLPPGERWRFHPTKQLAVARKGVIEASVDGERFTWPAHGDGITVDHGHRVVIAFHPWHPERGCQVLNAEFGPKNRAGWGIGEPLFATHPMELRAQWDERAAADRDGAEHPAKRRRGQVSREFRAIAETGALGNTPVTHNRGGARKSELADGRGRTAKVESGFDGDRETSTTGDTPARVSLPPRDRHATTPQRATTPAPDAEALAALEQDALKYL